MDDHVADTSSEPAASDRFAAAAGIAPARGASARWRQVALLSAAAAMGDAERSATALASVLVALDRPAAALRALRRAHPDDPWALWWGVLARGQGGDVEALDGALAAALERTLVGPDAREVSRRLADLHLELAVLGGREEGEDARFAVLGHRARPQRRMLIGGRSSAVYLVDPGWDAVTLVRLGPAEGTAVGNRALLGPLDLIGAVRRGDAGPGWDVPGDEPRDLEPSELLDALREDVDVRDRRLMELAREVAQERERLRDERVRLADDREAFELEQAAERMRRARAGAAAGPSARVRAHAAADVAAPRTPRDALALLGLPADAGPRAVERAWREQVVLCHPDRVEKLHPALRGHAEGLTVALNAARDLLLGNGAARPVR